MIEIELDSEEVDAFAATLDVRKVAAGLLLLKRRLELSSTAPDDRTGALVAILGYVEFICTAPGLGYGNLPPPLFKLQKALADLDDGVVSPMLEPPMKLNADKKLVSSRHEADTSDRKLVKAESAIAMELLMSRGAREKAAARTVGAKLVALGVDVGRTGSGCRTTVMAWRKEIKGGNKSSDIGTMSYYQQIVELKKRDLSESDILAHLESQLKLIS